MAGIGDYEKGKAFSLKSGNKPSFKKLGSSPTKMKGHGAPEGHKHQSDIDAAKRSRSMKDWGITESEGKYYSAGGDVVNDADAKALGISPAKHNWWVMDQKTGKNRNKAHAHTSTGPKSLEGIRKPTERGTPKKKSPNKWVQFIPMALSALGSMKKNKDKE